MAKKKHKKDPHHQREAEKYEHPVPSREFILQSLETLAKPATLDDLTRHFKLRSDEEYEGLRRRLRAMERDGQLMRTRRHAYALMSQMNLLTGRVVGHRDGFGFFIPDDGTDDIFLSEYQMRRVFTDDRVVISVSDDLRRRKREGRIVEVLERNTQQLVGKLCIDDGVAFVCADDKTISQDILILPDGLNGASSGQFVLAKIVQQPSKRHQAIGEITTVLGDHLTPGMEIELAIHAYRIPSTWPESVLSAIKRIPTSVSKEDVTDRLDLRSMPFCTIDGEDARDFDDAIFCEATQAGWRLYVAIADVSHYVTAGTPLDEAALSRGNSVYFPSTVVPMLPESLSNELCSLKPNVDRLTMVCIMDVNAEGECINFRFDNAVIHSKARLTYEQVHQMLETQDKSHPLYDDLVVFHQLYLQLLQQRQNRGSIEFETTETRMVFDDDGKIESIIPTVRNDAHKMIEEAMLLANVCASTYLEKSKQPALYRSHEPPNEDKISVLRDFLKPFGLQLTGGDSPEPKDYGLLLQQIDSRDDAHLLQTVLLRSLSQATYQPENSGHFGLAFGGYTHFTSPIRRYPDLIVHRSIKKALLKQPIDDSEHAQMATLGQHCSMTERRADRATRSASDWLKCYFMQDKVGQQFEGYIVDVTSFGLFVELKDIYVQGLVHVTALSNDYYEHDPVHHVLIGRQGNRRYRLGDSMSVLVARVDLDARKMDFEPI